MDKVGQYSFTVKLFWSSDSSMNMIPLHSCYRYYFVNIRINPLVSCMNGLSIINQKINDIDFQYLC